MEYVVRFEWTVAVMDKMEEFMDKSFFRRTTPEVDLGKHILRVNPVQTFVVFAVHAEFGGGDGLHDYVPVLKPESRLPKRKGFFDLCVSHFNFTVAMVSPENHA